MGVISVRVNNTNDDGCKPQFGSYSTGDVITGESGFSGKYTTCLRFTNITIPQGATISSAKITMRSYGGIVSLTSQIYGIAENNTASMSSDPTGRTKTSANVAWTLNNPTGNTNYDTSDITSIVQEIVNRGGWTSGNAMGFLILDNGSSDSHQWRDYEEDSGNAPLLTIVYVGASPSASMSPSASVSPSSSNSPSISASISPSSSISASQEYKRIVLVVAKDGINALETNDPKDFKFHSEYGTLKYFEKVALNTSFVADGVTVGVKGIYTHNLGYYPYVEVYVRVYIGSPSGNYEYCPFEGSGTSVEYSASYIIKENTIEVYGEINGISSSEWHFDFILFIFKNNLGF